MYNFFIYTLKYIVLTIIIALILEFCYTQYYQQPIKHLDKISWIKSLKESNFDYALFGSSRCFEHIDPLQIKNNTGLNGINLGYYAYGPLETKLMVFEFLKTQKPSKIFIEIADSYNEDKPKKIAIETWLPYLNDNKVYSKLKPYGYATERYFPFLKYMKYDSKIGFRNIFTSILGKNRIYKKNMGFRPVNGTLKNSNGYNFKLVDKKNKHYEELINLCKSKNIEIYFFTSPIYKCESNIDVVKKHIVNYTDFSNKIINPLFFYDAKHLNNIGAKKFTDLFCEKYFNTAK